MHVTLTGGALRPGLPARAGAGRGGPVTVAAELPMKAGNPARQDNLEATDQHGPCCHTLNPHIGADAVTAGRVSRRKNEEG